ncbi:MAG: NADH-dependent [FeFe] hydrogenase, group A6 [Candidatus Woesearchaeota archaeon]
MVDIKIKINGKEAAAKVGERLIDVLERNKVIVPTLCKNKHLDPAGACRLCVVEVEGASKLQASCTTPVRADMSVLTHTPRVIKSRRVNIELLLANHNKDCTSCAQNLNCKLQKYSEDLMIDEIRFEGERRISEPDNSSISIKRDNSKCVLCGQCYRVCNQIQTVYAINQLNRGFHTKIAPPFNLSMSESSCVNCGQCVIACPTGALSEQNNVREVADALASNKILIAQTAPSIRATLGELLGFKAGTLVTGKMVSALRELGFNKVFDTDLAADITIVEEATEFVKRFKSKKDLPMITTCCPAWIKFAEQYFFEQLNHMSSCRSPQAMLASLIKTYYAEKNKLKPEDIVLVDIMPCTAKKYEINRPEFLGEADFVLTTVELARLIKQYNINFAELPDGEFDNPLGESSGASVIFGRSGGVMEAALRTAADFITGNDLKNIEYTKIRGLETAKEATLKIGGESVRVCVVHTLGEARRIMNQIREGSSPYDFIEIMACYGGCVGGGGQPRYDADEILNLRAKALAVEDENKSIRKSHLNPSLIKLYKDYLGEFGGKKAHKLLHTSYEEKEAI